MRNAIIVLKFVLVFASILTLSAGCATGQHAGTHKSHRNAADEALKQREQAWADAMRKHDVAALEQILADEFRLTFVELIPGRPGKPEVARELWLENLKSMTFGPIEMRDTHITMLGQNVAAVRFRMILADWKWGEHVIPPNYDVTDIWVLRDGRWQVVNRISEPLDAPSGPPPASAS